MRKTTLNKSICNISALSKTHTQPDPRSISIANTTKTKAAPKKSRAAPKKKPATKAKKSAPKKSPAKAKTPKNPTAPLLALIKDILDDGKAEDVFVIDMAGKSTIADYMVVASGGSTRQINALADKLSRALKTAKYGSPSVEGLSQGDWVLLDSGDVIVHLFRPEVREFYNLEKMWEVALPDDGQNVVLGG